ncbi:4'-phosphopantetheinyl transferase superfamily protein [Microbispora sp. RL4-1S]|uniref:4'-phosphopantetheinyl transferase superfamily protein n=1 Tax=Microbispora oryzae TaxID=2806554 RepID=A0A940WMR5_9ACTN|nr:4'-phosphopantetheinyl transferase superfamily protein [Microbispora oryzae]MBP2707753.1 4'-phosphopantetheinyl transferase superfamily protein [Microbispora oryzae]
MAVTAVAAPLPARGLVGARIWRIPLDRPGDPGRWRCLSEAERRRAMRFAAPGERRRYVVAHAALRTLLGRLCGVPPERLAFGAEDGGRPRLDPSCLPPGDRKPPPDFNLSHSGDWALVAVAPPGERVGVDVERIRADLDHDELARRMYQPEEAARVSRAGLGEYFRLWTAKEAYVKATGVGLAGLRDVLVRETGVACETGAACETGVVRVTGAACEIGDAREAGVVRDTGTAYETGAAWGVGDGARPDRAEVLSLSAGSEARPVHWLDVAPGYAAAVVTVPSRQAHARQAQGVRS